MAICGLLHQDLGEPQALAHAAREGGDALVGHLVELHALERRGDLPLALGSRDADQARRVAQVVGGGEVVVEADRVRQIADAALDRERLARRVVAEHARGAGRDLAQAEQHQDGGGLAGAVRAEQAENLAARDRERDVVDGDVAVP